MSEHKPDPFAGIKWHSDLIVWDDPSITAETITKVYLGSFSYWKNPEYDEFREEFPDTPERVALEIERKILFDARRPNWGGVSKHGKPYYRHMLTLIRLMFPKTDISPSLADAVMLFCMGIGGAGRKMLNLIGCQDSGKSSSAARLAFAVMVIDAEYSEVFVANPFDNAADSTVWGDVEELWLQLKESFPGVPDPTAKRRDEADTCALFPHAKLHSDKSMGLELVRGLPKAGSIRLRNTKDVGKFKGSKQRAGDRTRGVMLLLVDEINEIKSMAFLQTLTNITGQDSFFAITSQNFKDVEDMGGRVTEPKATFGGPGSFEELEVDEHLFWHSAISSVTLRFDGERSPNILCGRVIYKYLYKQSNKDRLLENYGPDSPEYLSQGRSFPANGDVMNSVLTRQQISASRHDDQNYMMRMLTARVSFCDPAFGGRDKAVWGYAEFGPGVVTDGNGEEQDIELFVFKKHFLTIQLVQGAFMNDHWREKMEKAGIDHSSFTDGADLTFEEQIAIACVEYNRAHGIPHTNFGYDFSMRPDIVNAINRMMGFGAMAFDYNTSPEGVHLNRFNQNSEDICKNRIAELAFLASDLFISKQVRGGGFIRTALDQMAKTRYETKNAKKIVEGKPEYKARWANVSPDHRDVLMGLAGVAVRRGFRRAGQVSRKAKSGPSLWEKLSASKTFRGKVFKR